MSKTLYPHQSRTLDMLKQALRSGARRPMLMAPTGFGKTLVASSIIKGARAKGNKVLFVAPFLGLIDQTLESFAAEGITECGVIQADHPATDASQPVQIATIQSLLNRRIPEAQVVLVDEAHKWFAAMGEWMHDPAWADVPFIGLSASPGTRGLGKHYDRLLVGSTTKELIRDGFLSPYKVFAPAHPDLAGVKTVAGDFHEGQLSERMQNPVLVAGVVETWLRLGEDRPTLVFAVDRAHARKLADEFEMAGVPAEYVDMKTPRDERTRIGRRLAQGQVRVIVNVATLTTGIDWDVRCIVLARPTKSEMLFVQIVGRGLRLADGKADCLILDHSDTTLRLGFPDDIVFDVLDDGNPKTRAERKAKQSELPLPKECKACSFLKPAGVRKCPCCGFEPERQSAIEERQGELIALSGKRKSSKTDNSPEARQKFFSMCVRYALDHGHNEGSAAHRFKEKFGTFPRGLGKYPLPLDAEFQSWIVSRRIAWAKSKKRAGSRSQEASHAAA